MIFVNDFLWGRLFLPCVFLCGGILSIGLGFPQIRCFRQVLRSTMGELFHPTKGKKDCLSPLQAACTALASTVGTGNIVGTAQAICMGGPGAVFWLWVTALFGMLVKYAEIFLSLRYRRRDRDGSWQGGPMYYISALGKPFASLGKAYAFFAMLSAFGMGNLCQVNSGISAVSLAVDQFCPLSEAQAVLLPFVLGLGLAALLYVLIRGGAKRIGQAASLLVPLMSLGFLLLSLIVLICHAQKLPGVLGRILLSAFQPDALGGAAAGIGVREALRWGIRRSAFSNEAGLGSSALAHAGVDCPSPQRHSLWGIFEVFADTILICTATALVILCSGVAIPWQNTAGPELFQSALATVFGQRLSALFMAGAMLVFAFAAVLGWAFYGGQCFQYLFGARHLGVFRLLYCACVPAGCVMTSGWIWAGADLANALMAIPNFLALFLHLPLLFRELQKFFINKRDSS